MESDVCKHCTHAACLDVCPTGSLFRTEFGTVVVQEDICNGCGYCVPACPFGVIDKRHIRPTRTSAQARPAGVPRDEGGRPRLEVHALLRPAEGRPRAGVREGVPDEVDPVRPARRAARARRRAAREARTPRAGTARSSTGATRRRHRRLRRVLPAARRSRGVRPAARPGRDDAAPAARCGRTWRPRRRRSWSASSAAFVGGRREPRSRDRHRDALVLRPAGASRSRRGRGRSRSTSSPAGSRRVVGALARARSSSGNEKLSRTALYIGAAADAVSPAAAHLRPRPARALPPHAARRSR